MTTEQLKNRIDSLLADNTELAGYYAARERDRALTYIKDRSWTPQEVLNAFEIQQEQISALGKDEENLYLMAQVYGIAADFLAWKKEPGNPEDPPQFSEA